MTEQPKVRRGDRWLRPGPRVGGRGDTKTPRPPLLVRDDPTLLRHGTQLTDGVGNGFVVLDAQQRGGTIWFRLANSEIPDLENFPREDGATRRVWFTLEEMADLAYVRGERRTDRERF